MKITKEYLRTVIKEEINNLGEADLGSRVAKERDPFRIMGHIHNELVKAEKEAKSNPQNADTIVSNLILNISSLRK